MELDPLTVSDEELMRMVEQWELDADMDAACWAVGVPAIDLAISRRRG